MRSASPPLGAVSVTTWATYPQHGAVQCARPSPEWWESLDPSSWMSVGCETVAFAGSLPLGLAERAVMESVPAG